jgi:2,4-dienoyl-CoA reductase (NADPH2)
MAATHLGMAAGYEVTDRIVDFYRERARGGAGMITVGFATVDELSGRENNIGAHRDSFIPGLRRLATTIKENGSRASIQLNHAGRYNTSSALGGRQPVAPSPVKSGLSGETPRELTPEEIQQTISSFAQAALRAKKAGFDAVEVLHGTGYLISEFLSPMTNQRTDEYGGSFKNRMRFGLEVMKAVRRALGPDFPLVARMNGNEFMPHGLKSADLREYARQLVEVGTADALCINVGWHEARVPQIVTSVPRGTFAYLSRGIKEVVDVPVIASHRINDPVTIRELLTNNMCDMVAMARPLIADPSLPNKTQAGREREIVHCVACAQGCFDNIRKLKGVECLCNPRAGHEREARIERSALPLKVMVVGGGAAGMSAALAACERGHAVRLYEKSGQLGGQLFLAGAPTGREEFTELARDLQQQVAISTVRVVLNQPVDKALIERENPDAVILATGAVPVTPPIPGADLPHVVQAWDVLQNKTHTGRRVVVIGGGAVGVETALYLAEIGTLSGEILKFLLVNRAESPDSLFELATRGTKEIVMIEMMDRIGRDIGSTTRWTMLQDMARSRIDIRTATRALEITATGVRVKAGGAIEEIPADTVVLAAGAKSYNPLQGTLTKKGIRHEVIGDAKRIALAFDAIHQGFAAGRSI